MAPPTTTTSTLDAPTVAAIDPRIRARRIEVRRSEGRKKLQRLVDVGLLLLVAAMFVGALWTPLLDVDAIRVDGATHTGADAVIATSGIARGDRLIAVDVRAVGSRVAALPWVGEVRVHRSVDGTVAVQVSERQPVAIVGAGASTALVDSDGRVLGAAAGVAEATGLPLLLLADPVPEPGGFVAGDHAEALQLAQRLHATVPGAASTVAADGLAVELVQGGTVLFADSTQLTAKLRSLRTVLDQVDLRCLAVVDLTLPGSPVLTREERCS